MTRILSVDGLLRKNGIAYATVWRDPSAPTEARCATLTRAVQIARTVVLVDREGYALAVIPCDRLVDRAAIESEFERDLRVATAGEVAYLFPGLSPRALPPIADGLGLDIFVDQALVRLSAVYFETDNRRRLLRIEGESFCSLLYGAWCGRISRGES
jgi:prolyl-tRNA editing enzyme YbaK/EbsC (Cys-tRNA(Pro) deacylase)